MDSFSFLQARTNSINGQVYTSYELDLTGKDSNEEKEEENKKPETTVIF